MADRVDRVMSYRFEHRDRPSASLVTLAATALAWCLGRVALIALGL